MAKTTEPVVLESGDHLTREEFHRRYLARPDIKKAELVGRVAYVASPVSLRRHGGPHGLIGMWLRVYAAKTPGTIYGDNATVYLAEDGEVQPDALLFWGPPHGRNAGETEDGFVQGAPELVVEVAASSASYDLHDKKEAYRRAGVTEYIAWRTVEGAIDWFRLRDGQYALLEPDGEGMIKSAIFPGLRLPVAAMLAGDDAAVLAALGVRLQMTE